MLAHKQSRQFKTWTVICSQAESVMNENINKLGMITDEERRSLLNLVQFKMSTEWRAQAINASLEQDKEVFSLINTLRVDQREKADVERDICEDADGRGCPATSEIKEDEYLKALPNSKRISVLRAILTK